MPKKPPSRTTQQAMAEIESLAKALYYSAAYDCGDAIPGPWDDLSAALRRIYRRKALFVRRLMRHGPPARWRAAWV